MTCLCSKFAHYIGLFPLVFETFTFKNIILRDKYMHKFFLEGSYKKNNSKAGSLESHYNLGWKFKKVMY